MFFTRGPAAPFFYVIFGSTVDARTVIGNGNVAMYIMIAMAAYGAVTATTSIGGQAATERLLGWCRQLGLTPMTDSRPTSRHEGARRHGRGRHADHCWSTCSACPQVRRVPTDAWLAQRAALLGGTVVFAALRRRSSARRSAARTRSRCRPRAVVMFAFLGNVFIPMSGTMLDDRQVHAAVRLRRARRRTR